MQRAVRLRPAMARARLKVFSFTTTEEVALTSFDWRDQIHVVARHQGNCESCTAFAVAAAIELAAIIAKRAVRIPVGYFHTCIGHPGNADADQICGSGVDLSYMLGAIRDDGFPSNAPDSYPFPANRCGMGGARFKLKSFDEITSVTNAKTAIRSGPILADMEVTKKFFDFKGRIYRQPDASTTTLHTVCIIGFNSTGWIILNSMGRSWGDGTGCATVPYGTGFILDPKVRQAYSLSL
ncbi:papain family cysteine protease [Janthinobacterium sp. HH104]|uniref:C1 family peptidase n=1 Tax=Janthinobacterium sp. HH104 TaxID=1537276 RepID=UPI0008741792|nr:C1 family peptidase [Janthinobacterium sp. HH104]OEZ87180.1 papain family cysteine protease [Janthinobacterium sp. HH104]